MKKIYRLCIMFNKNAFCKNVCYFKNSESYFVGKIGLETAKSDFIQARDIKSVDCVKLDLCYIDPNGRILSIKNIEIFEKTKKDSPV